MHILHVIGARPNFMKAAPVMRALAARDSCRQTLIHTGQHYDANMSDVFIRELDLPVPDVNLEVGSGSHAQQTAQVMIRLEPVATELRPDLVLVYGDVNSTLAAALVFTKLSVAVGHVEAGLRSFDRTMPEEINRLLTDQIADMLFTPSSEADENLLREGVSREKIHLVGNVMIDTLARLLPEAQARWEGSYLSSLVSGLQGQFGLVTLHRPSNVDDAVALEQIVDTLNDIGRDLPLIFPVHPRTRGRLSASSLGVGSSHIRLVDPLSYLDFLALQRHATLVITDSGGIQEETTYLGVPCLTMRENTERPVTVSTGTNILTGQDLSVLRERVAQILGGDAKSGQAPPLWDGHAADRKTRVR